jgi:hypothetical protein
MDRSIVYPGSIPLDSDILSVNRNTMIALGALAQVALGSNVVVDGLGCTPTTPASMSVLIGPGTVTSFGPIDATAYGTLPADTTDMTVKMGINLSATTLVLTAPSGTNTAINYLVEASFLESDTNPVVLPYYNAANPSQPYSGPNNAGTAQATDRTQRVQIRLVAGAPAPNNTQVTPSPDPGWVGLFVITVFNTMTSIGTGSITVYTGAPFLPFKLPQLTPGQSSMAVITSSQSWTPPNGVKLVKLRLVGGGGGGGAGGGGGGGGGAGGGSVEGYYAVTPGTAVVCTIGAGGTAGSAGGNSSFGSAAVATGGGGGSAGAANSGGAGGAVAGSGSGFGVLLSGRSGQSGFASGSLAISGDGGGSAMGEGASGAMGSSSANQAGSAGMLPGAGGAGGIGSGVGGAGAPGLMVLEW